MPLMHTVGGRQGSSQQSGFPGGQHVGLVAGPPATVPSGQHRLVPIARRSGQQPICVTIVPGGQHVSLYTLSLSQHSGRGERVHVVSFGLQHSLPQQVRPLGQHLVPSPFLQQFCCVFGLQQSMPQQVPPGSLQQICLSQQGCSFPLALLQQSLPHFFFLGSLHLHLPLTHVCSRPQHSPPQHRSRGQHVTLTCPLPKGPLSKQHSLGAQHSSALFFEPKS